MRDFLNGDWNQGYTQAIQDIQDALPPIVYDLKYHHKRFNAEWAKEFLIAFFEHRADLRAEYGFLRYNSQLDKIEYYFDPVDD